jgi:phenylacetate-CoA ligase
MEASQWKKLEDLQRIQIDLMKSMVNYAATRVPYYANLLARCEVSPDTIRDFDDFAKIPISTKSMIRSAYPTQIYTKSSWFDLKAETSGSTGEPFESVVDGKSHGWRLASRYLFDSWMGIRPGEPWRRIARDPSASVRLRSRVFNAEVQVSMRKTTRPTFVEIVKKIDRNKPSGLSGAPSSLALLAGHIRDTGVTPSHKLKGVYSTMENLLTSQRNLISALLSPNLFNRYGLREFGGYVAQDCESHGGLHINPFLVYAEVAKGDGCLARPGEVGKLVITDLRNYAMPLIRYDTGDHAATGVECQCGRGFPVLAQIVGRESEYILTKYGTLSSLLVTDQFNMNFGKYLQAFQFIQARNGKVRVRIVRAETQNERFDKEVARFLASFLTDFQVDSVPEIRPDRSGKRPVFKPVETLESEV